MLSQSSTTLSASSKRPLDFSIQRHSFGGSGMQVYLVRRKVRCHDIHGGNRFISPASVFEYFYHVFFRVHLYFGCHSITLSTIKSPATLACISSVRQIVLDKFHHTASQIQTTRSRLPVRRESRSEAILLSSRADSQL